jgi:hypothetical protein
VESHPLDQPRRNPPGQQLEVPQLGDCFLAQGRRQGQAGETMLDRVGDFFNAMIVPRDVSVGPCREISVSYEPSTLLIGEIGQLPGMS